MKSSLAIFLLMAVLVLPGKAEFLQMDISIYGMD